MSELQPHSHIVRNTQLVATEMDGELVMMDLQKGQYYGLNRIGSRIWTLLEEPRTVESLCEKLQQEFAVEPTQCQTEVVIFGEQMLEQGLIHQI